jgi:ABC-2 type transport system ATP-binding protein
MSETRRPDATIRCHGVSKRFGNFPALEDVSFEIAGGIAMVVGPNGAGKSTLLKILAGLLAADRGTVEVAAKREIGVLPEDLGLFDALTIDEHLALCGPIYGLSRHETRERTDALLRVLGLEEGRHTFADQCSNGMRKKTALAMALIHNPRVLLLDEPFESIDPVSAKTIHDLLSAIAGRGITIFLTSHILSIVDKLADQILMIRGGRIVFQSAARDLTRPVEELYFELAEAPVYEDLAWLRSPRS